MKTKSFPTTEQFQDTELVSTDWLKKCWGAEIRKENMGCKEFMINRVYQEGGGARVKGLIYVYDDHVNIGLGAVKERGAFRLIAASLNVFELGSETDTELRGFNAGQSA